MQQRGQQCDCGDECPRMRIQANASQKWHLRRHILGNQPRQEAFIIPVATSTPAKLPKSASKSPSVDKLAHQPQRRCPQCASNRNLAPAALRAYQHKTRHIDARDQQQQSGPAQQG